MFNKVRDLIVNVLREKLDLVPKNNIGVSRADLEEGLNLPAISVDDVSFKVEEPGIGRALSSVEGEVVDVFSGDGRKVSFSLSRKPLRPTVIVEHPPGRRLRENVDFRVDYTSGVIIFNSSPKIGDENVIVKYRAPVEVRGLKFKIKYYIGVWSSNERTCNDIAINVIELLLREEKQFTGNGVFLRPHGGFNVYGCDSLPKGVCGKILEYDVEAQLKIKVPVPRIEKIEIKRL